MRFLFGEYTMDSGRRELLCRGEAVHVEPQVFDLIFHLVRNRDRVVSKDDLLANVWGGRIVSESTLSNRINAARRALGDDGERQQVIKTMAKRGLRFVGKVREVSLSAPALEEPPLAVPERPSIAVLPFTSLAGDPGQEAFADGLVDDILTSLSKLAGLRVIARNSSFVYKGRAVDMREVAKQLGVRYVLQGSVRENANRIRITAQLNDAVSGFHVWAERYERSMDDIFAVQDEITLVLATEMQVRLTEGEQARVRYTTTGNVRAWTHWVEGLSYYRKATTKENFAAALECWRRALELDPTSASLNAMVGLMHVADARFGWWDDRTAALAKARSYADRATELDAENSDANVTLSFVLLMESRHDEAVGKIRNALRAAPGSADVATYACFILASSGYAAEAIHEGERAVALSPTPHGYYFGNLGNAYRSAGRIEDAMAAFRAYSSRNPGFGLIDLAIVYQQNGRAEDAKRTAEQLLSVRPDFTIAAWVNTQFRSDKAGLDADIAALRAAGLG